MDHFKTSDQRVRLVQALCGPNRHAITAMAYVPGDTAASMPDGNDTLLTESNAGGYLRELVDGWLASGLIGPRCGLCGASSDGWNYEDARTRFDNMADAQLAMKKTERLNLAARRQLEERKN